ncbi:MAG TPA: glycosyltransferase family 4 protein [Candidatus Sulfomarinibacteraceae bacterium]|nr:glycosyltransferase family 4 protein [Candidatus Sulfomarinibacteraceae bacterium]
MQKTGSERPRRVCLIGPTYPYRGGIAHYTTLLAQQLRRAGEYHVLLISFSQQYPSWLFPGRDDRDPSARPLRTEAEYLLNPLNPLTWWRTWRRIKAWAPDLLVIPWWVPFWAPVWGVLGRAVKRLRHPPRLIFICHNVLPHESSYLDGLALRWALAPGDGFLVHSQADGERLRTYFPEAPLRVSPLPSYGPLLRERNTDGNLRLPDVPLLLFCGFVRPYKGLDILLQALPDVLRCRRVHLLVAGEFWQGEDPYRELVSELQLEEAVTFENRYVPDDELAAYLDAADVVVLPYRHATQSAVIQLAFGRGRPVITTGVGGLAEAVDHERTGLVVPPEDPGALAQAILRYFDEDLKATFTANIEREQERFSWERLVAQLEAVALAARMETQL